MGSLRDKLDKLKGDKNASSASKHISQTVPVKSEAPHIQENKADTSQTNSAEGRVPETGGSGGQTQPPVGLKGLALLKWRKDNGNVQPTKENKEAKQETKGPEIIPQGQAPIPEPGVAISQQSSVAVLDSKNTGTVDTEQLRKNLIYLANNIEQKELVGQVVRTIAIQIKQNPALMAHMENADMDLAVRGMRRSFAIVARKKTEARESKQSKTKEITALEQSFAEAGFKLDLS